MFIQVIQGHCRDEAQMRALSDEWAEKLGPGAEGWLGGTYGLTDEGEFVAVVRFESREAADANMRRPEQGEWWQRMAACFEGEVAFHDCDDAIMLLGGGSDEAGFVQVIQGRLTDPERFRNFMSQPMDALAAARPEIMGGTVAIDADGYFTETVAFHSESEARLGEKQEMPADRQQELQEEMAQVQDLHFIDLHQPWFSSARVG